METQYANRFIVIVFLNIFFFFSFAQLSFQSRGVGGGGALFSPAINPAKDDDFFVVCDMTELFHSSSFGNSYSQTHFSELTPITNTGVCYTATAGLLYTIDASHDMWLPTKSTDGGNTWTTFASPEPGEQLYGIWVDYNNPQRMIILGYCNVYFSNNGGTSYTTAYGCSTGNGTYIGGVFFDGNNIYIGTNDGLIVSVNGGSSFSGASYTGIAPDEGIFSLAGAKQGGVTRLYCLTAAVGDLYGGLFPYQDYWGLCKNVYAIDVSSSTNWMNKTANINVGNTDFPTGIALAQNDINTVYIGGADDGGEPKVWKSINGGASWTSVFNTANNNNIATGWSGDGGDRGWGYSEVVFNIAVAPTNANKVLITDFGFVHRTIDGGSSWQQAYVNSAGQNPAGATTPKYRAYQSIGLENTTSWQVFWMDSLNLFGAFSDIRGIRSTDGGNSWSFNYTGHTANSMYRIEKHPATGTFYAATSGIHDMYQSTRLANSPLDNNDSEGKIIFSVDLGATWQLLKLFNHPVFWLAIDPNNPNRMAASVIHSSLGGIYVTNDLQNGAAATWTQLPNPPRTEGHPATVIILNDGKVLCSYSGHRNPGFTPSSGVFLYDSSSGWSDVSDNGMYYWTKDVVVDPSDPSQNTWYAAVFSGWGGAANGLGGLYRTTNRGANWSKINTFDRVTSIAFNPNDLEEAYITTEQEGLWKTNDISATTPFFSLVQEYPFRQPERVYFNPYNSNEMWVTSFGNGLKMVDLNGSSTGTQNIVALSKINVYPNPFNEWFVIETNSEETYNYAVFDITGRRIASKSFVGKTRIDMAAFANGNYIVSVKNKEGLNGRYILTKQ